MPKDWTIAQNKGVGKSLTTKIITCLIIFFIIFKPLS